MLQFLRVTHFLWFGLMAGSTACLAQNIPLRLDFGNSRLEVQMYTSRIARVRITPVQDMVVRPSLSIVAQPEQVKIWKTETRDNIVVSTGNFVVMIMKKDGAISFLNEKGHTFLTAEGITSRTLTRIQDHGESAFRIRQDFVLRADEAIYGLGQFEDPVVNYRGQDILLAQANRTAVNPFLVSTRGYGILWNNTSSSRFCDAHGETFFSSDIADAVDYFVVLGPSMDQAVAGYRHLTGKAPLLGRWAYGYWQSKERYKTGSELIGVLGEYRQRRIPIDNIVQDWSYWGGNDQFSSMRWDSSAYPHPAAMIDSIHAENGHLMVSIWPAFGPKTEIFRTMEAKGFLFPPPHWNSGKVYDAFNPEAREVYWQFIKRGLFDAGVDAYWMDATEPEFRCSDDRYITSLSIENAGATYLGSFARYMNTYSLMTSRGLYEHHRQATDRKRVLILTRSAFTGQQRYGAITWSGDTFAGWEDLRVQVASGINFSMAGIPYWNSDIGGFITEFGFPKGLADPAYKELYVRWFQFGAFCPMFRSHGTNIPREIWQFGDPGDWAYDALVAADQLRYRLLPYIYSTAWQVTQNDFSFMRGVMMPFPDDWKTHSIADQYFFGSSIMVCPVLRPMLHPPEYKGEDITPMHFYAANGKDHGLEMKFYRGTDFKNLVQTRTTDASQIGWSGCLPDGLDTAYSVSLVGMLKTEAQGLYTFHIITDGGVTLRIGDSTLISKPEKRIRRTWSADMELDGGIEYPIEIRHTQSTPNAALLKINWERPSTIVFDSSKTQVYLPGKSRWFDFWTGEEFQGGRTVLVDAPLSRIPLFVPSGSIVPLGPDVQYAAESPKGPTEIRIYPGMDGHFELYDDEGDGYGYEKGASTVIGFRWNDKARILDIEKSRGTFPGAPRARTFKIVLVRPGHGSGMDNTSVPDQEIVYTGGALKVRLKAGK